MNRRQNADIPPKIILLILSGICIVFLIFSVFFSNQVPVLKDICGTVIVPMEKGVNSIGNWVTERVSDIRETKKIRKENDELKEKVEELTRQVKSQESDQSELKKLRELYALDQKFKSYPKIGARIIASDSSNWYNSFTIDKGSNDGIEVDMNVIAGDGLVGIVYDVGKNYAKVRSIIDDSSYVSSMFSTSSDNCIVNGDLKSIENGYITVDHINKDAKVSDGDELITSNISNKFLPGITIGYISDIKLDSNNLTKSGKVSPVVDFKHLEEVLVITKRKQDIKSEKGNSGKDK